MVTCWSVGPTTLLPFTVWVGRMMPISGRPKRPVTGSKHFISPTPSGDTDYTIKYLPRGQQYWFIVGTTNERFTEATYSEWTSLTTADDSTTDSESGQGTAASCSGDDYDRDEWGDYQAADPNATPRWTKPSDNVLARDITQDHHVALKDAHISGGCDWSATKKNGFSTDSENFEPDDQVV